MKKLFFSYALIKTELKQFETAAIYYQKPLALKHHEPDILLYTAINLCGMEKHEAAQKCCMQALAAVEKGKTDLHSKIYLTLGAAQYHQKNIPAAEHSWRMALAAAKDPTDRDRASQNLKLLKEESVVQNSSRNLRPGRR
jgi:tetratricopeptide (TPR) repeat protein